MAPSLARRATSLSPREGSLDQREGDAILQGYVHLDPIDARDNLAVPEIVDFVNELLQRKLLETF